MELRQNRKKTNKETFPSAYVIIRLDKSEQNRNRLQKYSSDISIIGCLRLGKLINKEHRLFQHIRKIKSIKMIFLNVMRFRN